MTTLAEAFQEVLDALDRTETPYLVGGSVASGTHGVPRLTRDIDFVIDLPPDRVPEFCEAFHPAFYADPDMVTRAVKAGRAFNLIHMASACKFDFFPVGDGAFGRSQLARRRFTTCNIPGLENIEFAVASPEDTILAKLVWFRKGGGVSEHQWKDVRGVIEVQAGQLDRAYLDHWAAKLGVSDLLNEFFQ